MTKVESRVNHALWVAESLRPSSIVEDPGYRRLVKTGRPEFVTPSAKTVMHDILRIFDHAHSRVGRLIKVRYSNKYITIHLLSHVQANDSRVSYQTDAWTSPNHRAFVAFYINLERDGHPIRFLLDMREVPCSHTGAALAHDMKAMMEEYDIVEKVSCRSCFM